jgi:CubicO group peptidase (beta-lactamase class C family)
VTVASTTKGVASLAMAAAHSRGLLDYHERVATYCPEFAQKDKAGVTVRQLLSHQAGLAVIDRPLSLEDLADLDLLAGVLAEQAPAWEPGTRQGYHGISLGSYEGELLRRVDPAHRTLGRFFRRGDRVLHRTARVGGSRAAGVLPRRQAGRDPVAPA